MLEDDGVLRAPWIKNDFFDPGLWVKDLIDFDHRDWDIGKLQEHFFPGDIIKIRAVKPVVSIQDFWIWRHNKSGDFSVKSAYWLAVISNQNSLIHDASVQPSLNPLKEQVWKLTTDPKIKVFLWKVLSGALLVADLLSHRGMKVDSRCQYCGLEGESIEHALFTCTLSRQIWALSDYPLPENGMHSGSLFSIIHHFLINKNNRKWPNDLRKSFPWIIWRIWKNRNLFFFEGKVFSPLETVQKVKQDVENWFLAQVVQNEGSTLSSGQSVGVQLGGQDLNEAWLPPGQGWLKSNVGTAWSKRNSLGGDAWVVRDDKGMVLFHSRRAFSNVKSKDEAKLLCVIWAIESMCSHRLNHVVFAIDAADLVGAILRPNAWPSFRYHAEELWRALRLVQFWRLMVEGSAANRGAHLIAKSVTEECRLQSYVATSHSYWLSSLFVGERV